MFIHDILLHWVFVVIWGLFIGFIIESLCEFSTRVFHSLSHFHYVARVVRVLWELFNILYFLDQSWYTLWVWELSNLLLKSPNQCLLHHPIMSDMIFLCCIDMCWSPFFLLSLLSSDFPSFLSYYLFPFSSHFDTHAHFWSDIFLHIIHMIRRWLDHFFSLFFVSSLIFPSATLKFACSWNSLMCYTLYTRVRVWSLGIWA